MMFLIQLFLWFLLVALILFFWCLVMVVLLAVVMVSGFYRRYEGSDVV